MVNKLLYTRLNNSMKALCIIFFTYFLSERFNSLRRIESNFARIAESLQEEKSLF